MRSALQNIQEQLERYRTRITLLKDRIAGLERRWEDELAKAAIGLNSHPNSIMSHIEDARQELVQSQATLRGLKRLLLETEEENSEHSPEVLCSF